RTGFSDDFHLIAQWFPKLAKLEPDGRFAHFAFHPFAEFYADFGDYRVEMDVPADHVVGSTGRLQLLRRTTDRAIYEARAQGVHDFAWVSARALEVEERRLDHVDVRVLSSSAGGARARSALWSTIEHALPFYEGLYGRYPHPTLTVVHPPGDAGPAGGMEYPMFFTVGQPDWVQTLGTRWLETVAAHELGHQWFQGILASNEARYPFLDEGLASHAEWRFLESMFGDSSQLDTPFLRISRAATGRYAGLASRRVRVIDQPATAFPTFGALSSHVYGRTALFLESLRRIHGDAAYDRAMRDYTTRQRFRHPTPPRLFESLGLLGPATREAAWAWFERSARASLRVGELISGPGGLTRVEVRRGGPIRLPLEVQARFADGSTQLRRLDSPNEREWIEFHCASPLLEVVVDPHRRWLIDDELFDNRVRPRAGSGAASFAALSGGMTGSFDTGPRLRWLAELALRVLSP
ncbi:MAG TPA: M1 family aminopeptidase, partial [Polyangiaceae bacterium]|nr:M1 family aminopeptidase [Polyangiaceae bacterium]